MSSVDIKITDDLINNLGDDLEPLQNRSKYANIPPRSKASNSKGGEVEFLSNAIPEIDGATGKDGNLSVHINTKQFHNTPSVRFWWPGKKKFERCELADILFLITYVEDNEVVGRRTMLSQTKYTYDNKYVTQRQWDPKPNQYHLLHTLQKFYPVQPNLGEWYDLERESSAFSNYSFVSDFWLPFFHSTDGMDGGYINYNPEQTADYHYERTEDPPSGYQSFIGYLKLFVRGQYGEEYRPNDRIGQFYRDLFNSNTEFNLSDSSNQIPDSETLRADGGEQSLEEKEGGIGLVNIVVTEGYPDTDTPGKKLHLGGELEYTIGE
ncbi:hypothetical protein [Halorussus sp. MSC15.2]|uniref:hypothetical protein n=1 Tax=Halorussus sp. MSC15.2 TaxID=2283638 RepID=UPI0013CF6804|nr:hypothetical protein [Halorussus sp. MSC15.2]NEU58731.1 hypothetical protein [Halorussus sp. MSC15.2]